MKGYRGWIPLAVLCLLIVAVGAYGTVAADAFLTQYNINNLLLTTMPLALVAIGQTNALLVGGFDVSVAAIVVKSSDPLELAGLCDRVVVMSRGTIVDEIPAPELSEQRIVEAIVGSRNEVRA